MLEKGRAKLSGCNIYTKINIHGYDRDVMGDAEAVKGMGNSLYKFCNFYNYFNIKRF